MTDDKHRTTRIVALTDDLAAKSGQCKFAKAVGRLLQPEVGIIIIEVHRTGFQISACANANCPGSQTQETATAIAEFMARRDET